MRFFVLVLLLCGNLSATSLETGIRHHQASGGTRLIRIIHTSDTQGYIEPCGCGGRNKGGFARRSTVIQNLKSEHPSILIDSGNLMEKLDSREQCDLKLLQTIAKSYGVMKYDGVGVGSCDLLYRNLYSKAISDESVSVLQVSPDQPSDTKPYKIMVVGGVRVGILSFGAVSGIVVGTIDIARARYKAYSEAKRDCDILVLLDQSGTATNDWIERVSKRFGAPDVVVGGADRLPKAEPEMVGHTMVVPTGSKGEFVGCVDVQINTSGEKSLTYSSVAVDPKVSKNPEIQALVDKYYSGEVAVAMTEVPVKKDYVSYTSCTNCHEREYNQWKNTPHAAAVVTLRKQDRAVPSCLNCHSEKYRTVNNLSIGEDDLQAVECASCHSDVLPHESKPTKTKTKTDMKAKCLACHNQERSPKFDYDKYVKLINHKRR